MMTRHSILFVLLALTVTLTVAPPIHAQFPHIISGYAYYGDGETPAAGINLTFVNHNTSEVLYHQTDRHGYYAIDVGAFGTYVWHAGDPLVIYANGTGTRSGWQDRETLVINSKPIQYLNFTLEGPRTVGFTYEPAEPTDRDTVQFYGTFSGPARTWHWDFGDGVTDTAQNPAHAYADDGTYTVTLTVTATDDTTYSIEKEVTVTNVPPEPSFAASPEQPLSLETVAFSDASYDPDGTIVNWTWDFGDGTTATVRNPHHRYATPGTFTVTLTVTDDDGAQAGTETVLTVANRPPVALFTYGVENLTITVDAETAYDPDGTVTSYAWRWDAGALWQAGGRTAAHTYGTSGTYLVALKIADDRGHETTHSVTVSVQRGEQQASPVAHFTWSPDNPFATENVSFSDASYEPHGTIVNWTWDFGDGTTDHAAYPLHAYDDDGVYPVTLVVIDATGLSGETTRYVTVENCPPRAHVTWEPRTPKPGTPVQFQANSTDPDGIIVNWTWDFGDGSRAYDANPIHTYAAQGTYPVTLAVTDDDGATAEASGEVQIAEEADETPGFMFAFTLVALAAIATFLRRSFPR
jgi:PKD repeat protein